MNELQSKTPLAFSLEENNPIVNAFLEDQVKNLKTFNVKIHENDEMLSFTIDTTKGDRDLGLWLYFQGGLNLLNAIRQIVNWKFQGFGNISKFLEFACGCGRGTRFLVQELPAERIWVSDIYTYAINFQREQFGVNGIFSVTNPEDYACEHKYNCIFVSSLFSHLPENTFITWLEKLYSMLAPDGVLMFSVNDEAVMLPQFKMPETGICYVELNESGSLSTKEYGTTWVTESFVRKAISRFTDGKGRYYRIEKALCHYQDLYVLTNNENENFSDLSFDVGPLAQLNYCNFVNPNELIISGWAVNLSPDTWIKEVQVLINGQIRQTMMPDVECPDVAQCFGDERFLNSGWQCLLTWENFYSKDIIIVKAISSKGIEEVFYVNTVKNILQADLAERENLQSKLQQTQVELAQLRDVVAAMESSKFWKMRKAWFRFKRLIRLKDVD